MNTEKKIQINLAIPESYRNFLRRMAAERMMQNPEQPITGTGVATELLLAALNEIGKFNVENKKEERGKENETGV
jgi:hypothetical protein